MSKNSIRLSIFEEPASLGSGILDVLHPTK